MHEYCVYILASKRNGTLYIGVTNNLQRRLNEHKQGLADGFTKKYQIHNLVYFEQTSDVVSAIAREKQLKGGSRKQKIDLIELQNPQWKDLCTDILGV
jgi:putative endonuclease